MNTIKPKILQKHDTIAIVSASGAANDEKNLSALQKAKEYFEAKGFNVKISPNTFTNNAYLAGSDEERINALHQAFSDKEVKAIIASRGGYGAIRILNRLDYNLIKNNPKIFAGFSDITAFQWMFLKKSGLLTFHAPMCCSDFGNDISPFTEESFWSFISEKVDFIELNPTFALSENEKIFNALFMPANLATLVSLIGFDFLPDEKIILALEDVGEPIYKIDRMMTQLAENENIKNKIAAIVLGNFSGVESPLLLNDFWFNFYQKYKIPIIDGLQFGHIKDKLTLPIGAFATLDFNTQKINF